MNDNENSWEEGDRIENAAKIADYIFNFSVGRMANAVGVLDYEPGDVKIIRSLCEKHPELIAAFMQTITSVIASDIQKEHLDGIEAKIDYLSD